LTDFILFTKKKEKLNPDKVFLPNMVMVRNVKMF